MIYDITGMKIPEIDFGQIEYLEPEGGNTVVISISNVNKQEYYNFCDLLSEYGYDKRDNHCFGDNEFSTFVLNSDALYLSFYPGISEMRVVAEPHSEYLSYTDNNQSSNVLSLITQIDLEDFGLSYVIRLSDGRFIIFDGGWDFEPDADKLMNCLKSQCIHGKPQIAAWILTHPHIDHYRCFVVFYQKYRNDVIIEKFIYNFPEFSDENYKKIPGLLADNEHEFYPRFLSAINEINAPVYKAHTGQIYTIGNARLEILSSLDDTFVCPMKDTNVTSLVIKMTIDGQTILWCADAYFKQSKLSERYGSYLKSDIMQVPHHGFHGGSIEGYDLIRPEVCLAPVGKDNCFSTFDVYVQSSNHLMNSEYVKEFITGGEGDITLELPYSPALNGVEVLKNNLDYGSKSCGAKTWFFSDIVITENEPCNFTILNATVKDAEIKICLYYEESKNIRTSKRIILKNGCMKKINLNGGGGIDGDTLFYNSGSLSTKKLNPGLPFAARFLSNIPVVITFGEQKAAYFY